MSAHNAEVQWSAPERFQGPDLAHIQDVLSQEPSPQPRRDSQNGAISPAPSSSNRRQRRKPARDTSRHQGSAMRQQQHARRSEGQSMQAAKRKHRLSSRSDDAMEENPLSQRYKWKSQWKKHMVDAEEATTEDWLFDIRNAALRELVHHTGVAGPEFNRLSERVTIDRLQDAWFMLSQWCLPRRFFLQHSVNTKTDGGLTLGVDFAMMAVLASALRSEKETPRLLHLEVVEGHDSDFAGALTGLILVIRALPWSSVTSLTLSLVCQGSSRGVCEQALRLEPVKSALAESLQRASCLRRICWNIVDTEPEAKVLDWSQAVQLHRTTEVKVKTLILLAGHARMQGRCRLFAEMPHDLLLKIFAKLFGPDLPS